MLQISFGKEMVIKKRQTFLSRPDFNKVFTLYVAII